MKSSHQAQEPSIDRINDALRRVVLMRETGPKNAAWQRARFEMIWRLHKLLDKQQQIRGQERNSLHCVKDT